MAEETESNEKRTALIVALGFTSFGKAYLPGDEVHPSDARHWPEGTLEKRVDGKFIIPTLVDVTPETPDQAIASAAETLNAADDTTKSSSKKSKE
jgi:hypothetical protein